jgi:hypothetical protein
MILSSVSARWSIRMLESAWRSRRLAVFTAILLAACSDSTGPSLFELAQKRALWQSQNLHFYTIEETISCFCAYSGQPIAIQVDADTVTSVHLVATGQEISKQGWQTVPQLFDYIEQLIETSDYTVKVRFDPSFGHPTFIEYSCGPNIADCGSSTTLRLLTRLD